MRRTYTFLLYFFIPFILIRLYWKGCRLPAYRQRIRERFSMESISDIQSVDVWLHAVSLGEVIAATPLIQAMLLKQWRVLVTTMTPTGSQQVRQKFGQTIRHLYVPYDLPWVIRRFYKKYKPRLAVMMETELWPNLIDQAARKKIPLLLVNARLSDKSFGKYHSCRFMFKPILRQFTEILTQSDGDSEKFIMLGARKESVQTLGNMKFDLQAKVPPIKDLDQLKSNWGNDRVIFIAASTHEDEEIQLLSRLTQMLDLIPKLLLLIAPRHPERFQKVYELALTQGFNVGLRSQVATISVSSTVVIIDSLGELLGFYQCADYAFVGGSLVPIGGHNVLEPIAVETPVFCGPHTDNFRVICQDLCAAGALVKVSGADELMSSLLQLHHNKILRTQQIAKATSVLTENRGTTARCMEKINAILS